MATTLTAEVDKRIASLIAQLAHHDPAARQTAREKLVQIGGHAVTRALVAEFIDPLPHVRWEAAKALASIADPVAAHGLMHALDDDDDDVRWVAGEGLIALHEVGLTTVLSGLTKRARSLAFCRGAHHVLRELRAEGNAAIINPVLDALDSPDPEIAAPVAAYQALLTLKPLRKMLPPAVQASSNRDAMNRSPSD